MSAVSKPVTQTLNVIQCDDGECPAEVEPNRPTTGWLTVIVDGDRWDFCPGCVGGKLKALGLVRSESLADG
jgi:hypothetical protein